LQAFFDLADNSNLGRIIPAAQRRAPTGHPAQVLTVLPKISLAKKKAPPEAWRRPSRSAPEGALR
jgi:hypothetical protein